MISTNRPLDTEFRVRISASLFSSFIPFFSILLFLFMRYGFEEKHYYELFLSTGISLFFLFVPVLISFYLKINSFLIKSESAVLLILIFVFTCLHYLPLSAYAIAATGLVSFALCLILFISSQKISWQTGIFFVLGLYFAIWVSCIVMNYHNPLVFETLSVNRKYFQAQDLFYNATYAQMIKYYGVPSTGLQGVPYSYYHFGSHWFFAECSKLTGIHVVRIYTIFYPLVIVPLFLKCFLTLTIDLRKWMKLEMRFSFLSFAVFFCVFLGIPNYVYSKGFYDASILVLESEVLSLIFSFALISVWLGFLAGKQDFKKFTSIQKIFIVVISPIVLWIIGLTKLSTLFVALGVFFFLILRHGLWKGVIGWAFLVVSAGSFLIYFYTVESIPFGIRSSSTEGKFEFGSFYASMRAAGLFRPFDWYVMFFLWTYAIIAVALILRLKTSWLKKLERDKILALSLAAFLAALIGLLPSFFLSFYGANAMFFANIQLFISGCFLIAIAPELQEFVTAPKGARIIFYSFCLGLFLLIHVKIRSTMKENLLMNLNTRILIANGSAPIKNRFSLNRDMSLLWNGFQNLQSKINTKPLYRVLKNLEKLDYLDNDKRSETLILITDYSNGEKIKGTEELNCVEKTFMVPALSGYAAANGALYNCSIEGYGPSHHSYQRKDADFSITVVCASFREAGFKKLLVYEAQRDSAAVVSCR